MIPFQDQRGTEVDVLVPFLEVAFWVDDMSGHRRN